MKELLEHLATEQIKEAYKKTMNDKLEIFEFDDKEELTFTPAQWLEESLEIFDMATMFHSAEELPVVATSLLSIFDNIVAQKYPEKGEALSKHVLKKILSDADEEEREQLETVFKDEIDELKKEGFEYEYAEEKHPADKDGNFEYKAKSDKEDKDLFDELAEFVQSKLMALMEGEDDE